MPYSPRSFLLSQCLHFPSVFPSQDTLSPDCRRRLRKTIIAAILCTDMSNHFTLTQEFKSHDLEVRA